MAKKRKVEATSAPIPEEPGVASEAVLVEETTGRLEAMIEQAAESTIVDPLGKVTRPEGSAGAIGVVFLGNRRWQAFEAQLELDADIPEAGPQVKSVKLIDRPGPRHSALRAMRLRGGPMIRGGRL